MLVPTASPSWWGSLLWLVGVAAAAFAIAWLSGTRLHIRKPLYIPLLLAVTAALSAGYLAWLGIGLADVVAVHWRQGAIVGVVVGAALVLPALRQPVDRPVHGAQRVTALGWEGVVYGTAEGVLLSALPPFIGWQLVHSLGWSGTAATAARWRIPLVGAAAVIVIHHLGYWSCRNRILIPITLCLSVLSTAFLVTASWLAPVIAHIALHSTLVIHGNEMPPQDRRETVAATRPRLGTAA